MALLWVPGAAAQDDNYTLNAGDSIRIYVYGEQDLTFHQLLIGPNGRISYPFLGELKVSGKTAAQLQQMLINGLRPNFLVDPRVSVSIVKYRPFFVNGEVKRHRVQELGLSEAAVQALAQQTPLRSFGLVSVNDEGDVDSAQEENRALTFIVPFAGLMLMFMMVMSVTPAMLNNVLEEKMQKISEFLVSSVTPFQLMMGKLTGAVGVGLTLSLIYLSAAFGLAHYFEISDRIPISLYAWFMFFLFIALVIFGSIMSAIGAACSEIRDSQSLMTPVILLVILPMMCIGPVFDSPSSTFSKAVSLFPPATPMLMFARIAMQPGPEPWEIVLAVILSGAFAIGCVWAAGKVFRVGILSQGQAPSFAKLISWIYHS